MDTHQLISLISISFCLFPVVLLLVFRLYINKCLLALGTYCLVTGVYNLMGEGFWPVPLPVVDAFSAISNYLDVPLIGAVFFLYANTAWKRKLILVSLGLFLAYELLLLSRFGVRPLVSKYLSGPAVVLVFGLSIYFLATQVKRILLYEKWLGHTLIAAAIFFAYGCYSLIYYFYYFHEPQYRKDVFLLYYIALFIFSLLVSTGLVLMYKKHRRIQEVQRVRKELALFFDTH